MKQEEMQRVRSYYQKKDYPRSQKDEKLYALKKKIRSRSPHPQYILVSGSSSEDLDHSD